MLPVFAELNIKRLRRRDVPDISKNETIDEILRMDDKNFLNDINGILIERHDHNKVHSIEIYFKDSHMLNIELPIETPVKDVWAYVQPLVDVVDAIKGVVSARGAGEYGEFLKSIYPEREQKVH